jgi:hypothetical protein
METIPVNIDALHQKFNQACSQASLLTTTTRLAGLASAEDVAATTQAWAILRSSIAAETPALSGETKTRFAQNRSAGLVSMAQEVQDMINSYLPVQSRLALGLSSRELFLNMSLDFESERPETVRQTVYLIRFYTWATRAERRNKLLFCTYCMSLHHAEAFSPHQVALSWWQRSCLLLRVCKHRALNREEVKTLLKGDPIWSWHNRAMLDDTAKLVSLHLTEPRPGLCCQTAGATAGLSQQSGCEVRLPPDSQRGFCVSKAFYSEDSIFAVQPQWEMILVKETRRKLRTMSLCEHLQGRSFGLESIRKMLTGGSSCPLAINGFEKEPTVVTGGFGQPRVQQTTWWHHCSTQPSRPGRRFVEMRVKASQAGPVWSSGLTTLGVELLEGFTMRTKGRESAENWSELVARFNAEVELHGWSTHL